MLQNLMCSFGDQLVGGRNGKPAPISLYLPTHERDSIMTCQYSGDPASQCVPTQGFAAARAKASRVVVQSQREVEPLETPRQDVMQLHRLEGNSLSPPSGP